jgi:hypothetical protein
LIIRNGLEGEGYAELEITHLEILRSHFDEREEKMQGKFFHSSTKCDLRISLALSFKYGAQSA